MPPKAKKLSSSQMMGAIKSGSLLMVERSLSCYGVPVPTSEINEHALILVAVEYEYAKIVSLMIKKGCSLTGDPDASYNGSPLHMAVAKKNTEILMILLHNLSPLEVTQYGRTPLLCAVHARQKNIILMLLQYGADWKAVDPERRTVLHLAIGYLTSIRETESTQEMTDILRIFLLKGMPVDAKSREGETPLHLTIKHRRKELVEFLLLQKANINVQGKNGDTVLHILVRDKIENHKSVMRNSFSIDYREEDITSKEEQQEKSKAQFIDWLVSKGADINLQNDDGETPLQLAIKLDQKQTMQILLKYSYDSNSSDIQKDSLLRMLIILSIFNHKKKKEMIRTITTADVIEVMKILIEKGLKVDNIGNDGQTPIYIAAKYSCEEALRIILRHSTNLNMADEHNKTVLHTLLDGKRNSSDSEIDETAELVKMFLEKGASTDYVNAAGNSPISIAAAGNRTKILKVLLQHNSHINVNHEQNRMILHTFLVNNVRNADLDDEESIEIVKMLLERGALIDCMNKYYSQTPVSVATTYNQKKILKMLLQYESCSNMGDKQNRLVLHSFLGLNAKSSEAEETVEIVKLFLEKGALVGIKNRFGVTPLWIAAKHGQKKILKILLNHDTSLNMAVRPHSLVLGALLGSHQSHVFRKSKGSVFDGRIGAEMAGKKIHLRGVHTYPEKSDSNDVEVEELIELVELLLKRGALVSCKGDFGQSENTPLSTASLYSQKKILKILLQHDPHLDMSYKENKYVLQEFLQMNIRNDNIEIKATAELVTMMLEKGATLDTMNVDNDTPMHIAAKYKQPDLLWILLPYFIDVNVSGSGKNTVVHVLANTCIEYKEQKKEYVDIMRALISKGANINLKNADDMTPLQLAAKHKNKELLKILVEHGANMKITTNGGASILHLLSLSKLTISKDREKEVIQLFINHGCNVNAKTKKGMTALHLAAQLGNDNTVVILIELGADLHCTDIKNQDTPLHLAARHDHESIVEILLKHGADIEIRQRDGLTALHISTELPGHKMSKLLLDHNADIEALDNNRKTPLHYACWYENAECIDYFIERGADINAEDNHDHVPLIYVSESSHGILDRFFSHIAKRYTLMVHLADMYHNFFNTRVKNNVDLNEFVNSCCDETNELASIMVDSRTSLMDVLRRSLKKQPVYQKKIIVSGVIYAEEFRVKCPIYRDLVMASYHRCVERFDLMEAAQKSLRHLIGMHLPDFCIETIFSFLDNKSLRDVIKSEINMNKRILNPDDDSASSAKR